MNGLNEFWHKLRNEYVDDSTSNREVNLFQKELGMFFWGELLEDSMSVFAIGQLKRKDINAEGFKWMLKYYSPRLYSYVLDCLGVEKVNDLVNKLGALE